MEKNPTPKEKKELKEKKEKKPKEKVKIVPWVGTNKDLKKDEELVFDNRAYEMFHRATMEWPCLSCDFVLPLN